MTDSEQTAELLARNAAVLDSMSQLLATARQQLAEVQQLNRDLRARTVLAQSPDRMVTVVVDGVGGLRQLSFDRDAFEHHTPASLADAVAHAVREATRELDGDSPAEPPVEQPALPHATEMPAMLEDAVEEALLEPARLDPPGLESPRFDPAGLESPRFDSAGLDPAGLDPARFDPAGLDPAAVDRAAVEPAMVEPGFVEQGFVEPEVFPPPVAPEPVLDPVPVPVPVAIQDPAPPAADQTSDSSSQIDHVVTALSRLQSYTGIVTRVLGVRDPERAAAIAGEYELGDTIIEKTFLSTSANPAYTGDGLVRYTIDARHGGKLIGAISEDGERFGEVVFGPGSRFRVTGKRYYPSIRGWDIALEELG